MRFNIHAKIEIAALALLLLGSCEGPGLTDRQRDEVDDIADAAVSDNEKVKQLDERVSALEQKLGM